MHVSQLVLASAILMMGACSTADTAPAPSTSSEANLAATEAADAETTLLPYEKFTLENGLEVIFHVDRSDPVVAVSLTAHVGSAREKPGRTGFAHLFEHLLFLESENLGPGGLDKLSARIGGSGANGSTSRDRTNYLQTVPNDALEKMLWAEADKLGWFINTVTEPVLAKEKQVVKNEKRQGVDNRPYGHTFYVMHKALYPDGHPYNWQVIGSLEDLQAATLEDVKEFYRTWYTPNNVTLVVAGDFDTAQAREWVETYFAEIPRGPDIEPQPKEPGVVTETVKLFHEDNFAKQPQLNMVWPTVEEYHPDSYPLAVLAQLLTDGKDAPLNEVLVDEEKLAPSVAAFAYTSELAGEMILRVSAFEGTDLDTVAAAIEDGLARFEAEPITEDDLNRIKTEQEVAFYQALGSVLGKGAQLAQYNIFAGDPGYIDEDLARIQAVTAEDVRRVYETYIKGRNYVATSFVPNGSPELALEGSERAEVVIEPIVQGAEDEVDPTTDGSYERTPSLIDRSVEPPYGAPPEVAAPDVWEDETANGIKVYGISDDELPLVRFSLSSEGGHLLDTPETAGTANMLGEVLTKGTASKTPAELDKAFALLGADVSVNVTSDAFEINGETLARNFLPTMALVEEMLLEPRWDEAEFDLAVARTRDAIQANQADPNAIASRAYSYVTFGANSMRALSTLGSETSLDGITLDDLKAWHSDNLVPQLSSLRVVGDVSKDDVMTALSGLSERWSGDAPELTYAPAPDAPDSSTVYFYDVPGSSQSVFRFGYPSLNRTDPDFVTAGAMNYRLGGGGFASRLTQELREGKGYTYGIFSDFDGTDKVGTFTIGSGIRSNVTLEAATLVRDILSDYAETYTEEDLAVTKSFFTKSQARRFETLGAKLGALSDIADYGLPYDFVSQEIEAVEALSLGDVQGLAARLIRPDEMNYVIVGDAETQMPRLSELGYGEPVAINDAVDDLSD
ncbi:insulinase family protein [Thalassovita mediterranea]|nr:insulinase family protein [Thalassovita mediterranea]